MQSTYQTEDTLQHVFLEWDKDQTHFIPEKDHYKHAIFACNADFTADDHDLDGFDFSASELECGKQLSFTGVDLTGCNFRGFQIAMDSKVSFTNANLTGVNFSDLHIHDALVVFDNVNLTDVDFSNLRAIPNALIMFQNCNMAGIDWTKVPSTASMLFAGGTDLSQSNIEVTQLAEATDVSADCRLPAGITHAMIAEEAEAIQARKSANKALTSTASGGGIAPTPL